MSTTNEVKYLKSLGCITEVTPVDPVETVKRQNLEEAILRNAKRGNIMTIVDLIDITAAADITFLVMAILNKPKIADTSIEAKLRSIIMNSIYQEAMRLSNLRSEC